MTEEQLSEIWDLLESAANAPTKASAKQPLSRLRSILSVHRVKLPGYTAGKLSEAISCASEASGQVSNKEHWISTMHGAWYVFKSDVESGQTYAMD
jgi:hypothetical protein